MSKLKEALIAILEQNSSVSLCGNNTTECFNVECSDCPFLDEEAKEKLIKEIKGE